MFDKTLYRSASKGKTGIVEVDPYPYLPVRSWDPLFASELIDYLVIDKSVLWNGRAIKWSPDGRYFYIAARRVPTDIDSSGGVVQYEASTPYDIQTLTLMHRVNLRPLGEDAGGFASTRGGTPGAIHGMQFRPDGKRVLINNRWEIWQFDLTTAWDISTMQQGIYRDTWQDMDFFTDPDDPEGTAMTTPYSHDIFVGKGGTRIYIDQRPNERVNQYNLSRPWDITSMEHQMYYVVDKTTAQYRQPIRGTEFDPSGYRMFTINTYGSMPYITVFNLDVAWELSTASFAYEKRLDRIDSIPIVSHEWHPSGQEFWVTNMHEGATTTSDILDGYQVAILHFKINKTPT